MFSNRGIPRQQLIQLTGLTYKSLDVPYNSLDSQFKNPDKRLETKVKHVNEVLDKMNLVFQYNADIGLSQVQDVL